MFRPGTIIEQGERGNEDKEEWMLCGAECVGINHVLRDCPTYNYGRAAFLQKLQIELGDLHCIIRLLCSQEVEWYNRYISLY